MKTKIFINIVLLQLLSIQAVIGCNKDSAQARKINRIEVSSTSLNLKAGQTWQLKASTVPATSRQPVYQWKSADNAIVTVTNGLVKAHAIGETIVTVSTAGVSTTVFVRVDDDQSIVAAYDDTVLRLTLKGADCPFADHAEYGIYIPTRKDQLRGVLILQHGCGMEQFGITRPYDLQYRALAKKWKLAIVETALYGNCGGWRDPGSGSGPALLKILNDAGIASGHEELKKVPWLLWGHSGGGYWVLGMLKNYPERIMAAVCYSPAFDPQWNYPASVSKIPILLRHAGANDANSDGVSCQATSVNAFRNLKALNTPVSIALNESQNHNFSYLRYIAIPFYEAVMQQRMPTAGSTTMHELDHNKTWLADTLTLQLYKESGYTGNKKNLCVLPDEATAINWKEYVSTGTVTDKTPPVPPFDLAVMKTSNGIEVKWDADADIESGIMRFEIFMDGSLVGTVPGTGDFQHFDTNGDNTFPVKVPEMRFMLTEPVNKKSIIHVRTINHFNLPSSKAEVIYNK